TPQMVFMAAVSIPSQTFFNQLKTSDRTFEINQALTFRPLASTLRALEPGGRGDAVGGRIARLIPRPPRGRRRYCNEFGRQRDRGGDASRRGRRQVLGGWYSRSG